MMVSKQYEKINRGRLYRGFKKGEVSNFLGLQLIQSNLVSWAFWYIFCWNRPFIFLKWIWIEQWFSN